MYESTAERIKILRRAKGLTQAELAKKINVGHGVIGKYEAGYVTNIKRPILERMAVALDTTPGYIMGWDFEPQAIPGAERLKEGEKIPLLGMIACGQPILADENIEAYVYADVRLHADFALRCRGNSMINARIFDGDIVYIKHQEEVANGEIAAVLIGDEATLKRFYRQPGYIELRAENPLYSPMIYEGERMAEVHVLGKAVAFLSTVR